MSDWERCTEIEFLRKQCMSLRAIARKAGVSENTAHKYPAGQGSPQYAARSARALKELGSIMSKAITSTGLASCCRARPCPITPTPTWRARQDSGSPVLATPP